MIVQVVERIFVGAEPGQSFPVHVYGERMERRDEHVQPQIVFVSADQHGVLDVPLHHDVRIVNELADLLRTNPTGIGQVVVIVSVRIPAKVDTRHATPSTDTSHNAT